MRESEPDDPDPDGPDPEDEVEDEPLDDASDEPSDEETDEPRDDLHDDVADEPRDRRVGRIAGIVLLAYAMAVVIGFVILEANPATFNSITHDLGRGAGRVLLCGVFLALLIHLFDGLRVTLQRLAPRLRRRDRGMRALVNFTTAAVWVPLALVVLWPFVRSGFPR